MDLSIVVVVVQGAETLARCLDALGPQIQSSAAEIIVPHDESLSGAEELHRRLSDVRFLAFRGQRTYAELRAAGVREARGRIVALTEDQCIPRPDWCRRILEAHSQTGAAMGGPVEKVPPDTAVNWAIYFCDYLRYMMPETPGPTESLTDCNVTYKRSSLLPLRDLWEAEFHEPVVHGALRRRGESLQFCPGIIVEQRRNMSLRAAVRDRYSFGRLFGSTRLEESERRKRWVYAAATPLLTPLLLTRMAGQVARKRRHIGQFVRATPVLLLLTIVWCWGETCGYVTGRAGASLTPSSEPYASCREKGISQTSS